MKRIQTLVDQIDDELCSAKDYAECYLWYRAEDNGTLANKYKEMALDELKHSTYLHDIAMQEIVELEKVYKAPQEMQETWQNKHKSYVEKHAWVKQMLSL